MGERGTDSDTGTLDDFPYGGNISLLETSPMTLLFSSLGSTDCFGIWFLWCYVMFCFVSVLRWDPSNPGR